jgi:hypothetical protein
VTSNTRLVLFFLFATVFNILLMALLVLFFFGLAAWIHTQPYSLIILFVGFIASIVLTFLAYGRIMKWVTVRFNLEKQIPQLFKKRRN